jgi:predicted nucleotidyltransferase
MVNQNQILQYLSVNKQKYHLKKVGILGSYARNEQTPESDLDILVEYEDNTSDLTGKDVVLDDEFCHELAGILIFCTIKYTKIV